MHKIWKWDGLVLLATLAVAVSSRAQPRAIPSAAKSITAEVVRATADDEGHPLPLAGSWNTGSYHYTWPDRPRGFDPDYMITQVEKGHHVMPSFSLPGPDFDEEKYSLYLYPPFEKARDYRLPFTLIGSQWEHSLTDEPEYFDLPAEQNPNVVTTEGEILKRVDPFGPTIHWYTVGKRLTSNPTLARMQEIYPDPPQIIFLSNNEHGKLYWHDVEISKRYLEKYGPGRSDGFKRKVVGDAWIEKYRALQKGMRDGLTNEHWKEKAVFVGYSGDLGMSAMGRWPLWARYGLHSPGRISPAPYMWDGISDSCYQNTWSPATDYTVMSPQIEMMNSIPEIRQAYAVSPRFWYELSLWDGDTKMPKPGNESKLDTYRKAGQTYDNKRYAGWLQYCLWLRRPRVMREYRDWTDSLEERGKSFETVMSVVDRVSSNETLEKFWRRGELVPNLTEKHPYQFGLPHSVVGQPRWFLLDADVNPKPPFELMTEIPVFSLAYQLGTAPNRKWLLYAYAPLQDFSAVGIAIPQWKTVKVDVPRDGAFYEIQEEDGSVRPASINESTQ